MDEENKKVQDEEKEEKKENIDTSKNAENDTKMSLQEIANKAYLEQNGIEAPSDDVKNALINLNNYKIIVIVLIIGIIIFLVLKTVLNNDFIQNLTKNNEETDTGEKIDNSVAYGTKYNLELSKPTLPEYYEESCSTAVVNGITWNYCLDDDNNAINVYSTDSLSGEVNVPGVLNNHPVTSVGRMKSSKTTGICAVNVNCKSITSVVIPEGVKYLESYLFIHLSKLTKITLPDSIEYIGDYAFYDCASLAYINSTERGHIVMPDSLVYYGTYLFGEDVSITSFEFPERINYINSYTFTKCTGFRNLVISGQYQVIYPGAFAGASKLKTVTFEDGVLIVAGFANTTSLQEVKMADSVIAIFEKAFMNDTNIEVFEYNGKLKYLGYSLFGDNDFDINSLLSYSSLATNTEHTEEEEKACKGNNGSSYSDSNLDNNDEDNTDNNNDSYSDDE